jgi:polysaccharide deacetylase family protein (PEP-CTERM system associated)
METALLPSLPAATHSAPRAGAPGILNALTVDVEEYYHATIVQEAVRGGARCAFESRVVPAADRLLSLLADHRVTATLFVLGEVAAAHPQLIRRMASLGHEIACHGYSHTRISSLTRQQFRSDIARAKGLLEDLTSEPVVGYRAPDFSLPLDPAWVYDTLAALGFTYDSSVYPIRHDRYGDPSAPRAPYALRTGAASPLVELPVGTLRLMGANLPIGGGGYFRLLPLGFVRWGIRRVNRGEHRPVVFYVHPWELDPDQPSVPMPAAQRFRHYVGLRRTQQKLAALLAAVRFGCVREVYAFVQATGRPRTSGVAAPESESRPRRGPLD